MLVTYVSPSVTRSVVTMDTPAISRGRSARNDPNTNPNTASAPAAPNSVSTRTPGPLVFPPVDSSARPVTDAWNPAGSDGRRMAIARFDASGALKSFGSGVNSSAYVVRP